MSHSLEWILDITKNDSGLKDIIQNEPKEYETLVFLDALCREDENYISQEDGTFAYLGMGEDRSPAVIIEYDKDANFNKFFYTMYKHDGTLLFTTYGMLGFVNSIAIFVLKRSEKVHITMGNVILVSEFGKQFGTEEKPWLRERDTIILPVKIWQESKE